MDIFLTSIGYLKGKPTFTEAGLKNPNIGVGSYPNTTKGIIDIAQQNCPAGAKQLVGENGYDILKQAVSGSFQTIMISAYTDQAIEAFEYGVLDFVPKPFGEDRLRKALGRYSKPNAKIGQKAKYVVARRGGKYLLIYLKDIVYFRAEGYLVEVNLS